MNTFRVKFFDAVADVAIVVGSAVGVGLISGKETQLFIGTVPNAVLFAVVFCIVLSVFREFCRKKCISDTSTLATVCFKRFSALFNVALCACAFVCVVTCLAGVEQCLSDILYLSDLPLYAVCVAAIATLIMIKGMSALRVCNVISIAMALALFVALAATSRQTTVAAVPKPYMPIIYALFNFAMSLAITCKLGAKSNRRANITRSVLSAAIIAALLIAIKFFADFDRPLPTLSAITNPFLKIYATITVAFASTCGIVGCAIPVCEFVDGVIGDRTVSALCVFLVACAFSMFGFDFLISYGYVFVALIGATVVLAALCCKPSKKRQKVIWSSK